MIVYIKYAVVVFSIAREGIGFSVRANRAAALASMPEMLLTTGLLAFVLQKSNDYWITASFFVWIFLQVGLFISNLHFINSRKDELLTITGPPKWLEYVLILVGSFSLMLLLIFHS